MIYMQKINYPCVLTIAGTDPSGGAGIQADIKSIAANRCYAASVITALVAQNTQGVQAIQEVPANFVMQQLESVFTDLTVSAVKIGMLHNAEVISAVSSALQKFKPKNIVLDPVMLAKNGSELISLDIIDFLKEKLFPIVNLITPNLFEAEQLLKQRIVTTQDMEFAAKKMGDRYNLNVLLKGGHLNTDNASDVLYTKYPQHTTTWFDTRRIVSKNTHGTGCTLSAAIASYLAKNYPLIDAIRLAKRYLTKAIQHGSTLKIGLGCGPVHHFYFLDEEYE